ncbi:MAG: TetR/AcrR family transcriptional regulator [Bernardetiaceae bacterium]
MGIQERKEREREEMRQQIIEAARYLFVNKGIENTSIRAIAERIEYSPATIYLYFKDKDEILYAVHEQAFFLFLDELKKIKDIQHPLERLKALGKQYVQFAMKNPEYYDLMFILRAPMQMSKSRSEDYVGIQSYHFLYETVQECIDKGYIQEKNTHKVSFMVWSYVHGTVSLYIRERTAMYPSELVEQIILDAFDLFASTNRYI